MTKETQEKSVELTERIKELQRRLGGLRDMMEADKRSPSRDKLKDAFFWGWVYLSRDELELLVKTVEAKMNFAAVKAQMELALL